MLRQLYFVPDIMARYHFRSKETARRYMREMGATGHPLFVTEEMINKWELTKQRPCWSGPVRLVPAGLKIPRRK